MAFEDYTKKIRINEDQLEELKKLADGHDISAAKLLHKILAEKLNGKQQKLKLKK